MEALSAYLSLQKTSLRHQNKANKANSHGFAQSLISFALRRLATLAILYSDTLIKQLYEAFPLRPLPTQVAGKRTIYDDEYSYVEEFFHGREWDTFSLRTLLNEYRGPHEACLSFMSSEAFNYYLPGFMKISIEEFDPEEILMEIVLYELTPSTNHDVQNYQLERFSTFNQKQIKKIVLFFDYMQEKYGEEFKLSGHDKTQIYWSGKLTKL